MNYTKKMGVEALNRSLLLMSYDNKKTLTENVDNILIEQKAKPLDPNKGPKVVEFTCKVPGDKNYVYTFKDNNWFALNIKNNKRFNLTYLTANGFPQYQKSIDILVKTCPAQLQTSATTQTTDQLQTSVTTQTTDQSQTQQRNNEPVTQMDPKVVNQIKTAVKDSTMTLKNAVDLAPNNIPLVKEFCKELFKHIDKEDQTAGRATATPQQRDDLSRCLQQYNFGIGQGVVRMKRRYGLTSSGGDKGIR